MEALANHLDTIAIIFTILVGYFYLKSDLKSGLNEVRTDVADIRRDVADVRKELTDLRVKMAGFEAILGLIVQKRFGGLDADEGGAKNLQAKP